MAALIWIKRYSKVWSNLVDADLPEGGLSMWGKLRNTERVAHTARTSAVVFDDLTRGDAFKEKSLKGRYASGFAAAAPR